MGTVLVRNIATLFGTGFLKGAPGTWGSLISLLPGFYILEYYGDIFFYHAIVLSFFIGVWAAGEHEKITDGKDNSEIVIDELCGQWIAIIPMLYISPTGNWVADYAAAFILFRIFDIFKPWPIRAIDKNLKGGAGVMLDDVLAGVMAAAILYWAVPLL
jgi:phosphatidylglycerophosphatase A